VMLTAAAMIAILAAPAISHREFKREASAATALAPAVGQETFLAGPRLTGLLVVPDNAPQSPIGPPTMTFSSFRKMIKSVPQFDIDFGDFVDTLNGDTAFAFVSGLALDRSQNVMRTYIAPPSIFCRDCWAIRAKISRPFPGWDSLRTIISF